MTDWAQIQQEGARRLQARMGYATTHDGSPHGSHILGTVAEKLFGDRYGFEVDLTDRPNGDGGHDFIVTDERFTFRVNVQGRIDRRPLDFCLPAGKQQRADIHVLLALLTDPYRVASSWWCFEFDILAYCPTPREPLKAGMPWNHMMPVRLAHQLLGSPMDRWFLGAEQIKIT